MRRQSFALGLVCSIFTLAFVSAVEATTLASFKQHQIDIAFDVPNHSSRVSDSGMVQVVAGWNMFFVNKNAKVESLNISGQPAKYLAFHTKDTAQLPPEILSTLPKGMELPEAKLVFFKSRIVDSVTFAIRFSSVFNDDVQNVRFSREAVGNEVTGTIGDQGSYLSSSAYYYPQGSETMARFSLRCDIPAAWEAVSDGNRVGSETKGDRKIQAWENPYSSDGCTFMAAPYVVRSAKLDSIEVFCYFFEADTGLIANYLSATTNYIKSYSELIGPYPFKRFTVAENFFPTGYGMPAWTLLGQTVIRLPFIISTSLGHEVLHNWWGNSIYVDYDRGNWCEGATVYGADYRYKLAESPASARQYRKDILKEYLSYVSKDKDFPIREFKSRTSPSTRSVGYNKSMMVFHMIEQEIGTKAFFDTWKLVYTTYVGKKISWEEWIKAFEKTSGVNLSYVIPQWVDRAGAPVLGLEILGTSAGPKPGTKSVQLKITEKSGSPYQLKIPIRTEAAASSVDTVVSMTGADLTFSWTIPDSTTSISVDPEYHLFRRLYPEEVEPIVSAILGAPKRAFVATDKGDSALAAFKEFGGAFEEDSVTVLSWDKVSGLSGDLVPVLLNPKDMPDYIGNRIQASADSLSLGGATYACKGHTFVLTGQSWKGFGKFMVVLTDDFASLPRLGQLVPHYGKYSYLVFEGAKNVGKGQWEPGWSPLRVSLQK